MIRVMLYCTRQNEANLCTTQRRAIKRKLAVMQGGNSLRDGQAQTTTVAEAAFGPMETFTQPRQIGSWKATAAIIHLKHHLISSTAYKHAHLAVFRGMTQGIVEQILYQDIEQTAASQNHIVAIVVE